MPAAPEIKHYKTIVISDTHLGTSGSKAREVVKFLQAHSCDLLLMNGDIIDGWELQRYGNWKRHHTQFMRTVMKMMERQKTRVVYTRGNHDDFLDSVIPLRIGKRFFIQRELIYESFGKRYLVTHGDVFDSVTKQMKWIAQLGSMGYTFLLWVNKVYNKWRVRQGKPYYSLSSKIKARVKQAVSYISDFEVKLVDYAKSKKCDGVICGHIHQPAIKQYGTLQYLNSGDWVESMTALLEDDNGVWTLYQYVQTPDELIQNQADKVETLLDEEYDEEIDLNTVVDLKTMPGLKPLLGE